MVLMRQVLSDQRLRSHPCLVATYDVTGKNAPAAVELYALGRHWQTKSHIIAVQQLCGVTSRSYLQVAASLNLKVPPPKKKIVRSEGASQRPIRERQRDGVTLRLRPGPGPARLSR
jgi:hypothetical protein